MATELDLSVIIPVFNEEDNLEELYHKLAAILDQLGKTYEILLIDDGSTDRSFEILTRLHKQDSRVKAIRFRRNFGQTAAFAAGFENAKGDVIITMDADLQNDPCDIPRVLKKMDEGYDVVSGWRKDRKDVFLTRKLPSLLANKMISWGTGVSLNDYGCSLKAYRREVISGLRLYGGMHRFIPAYAAQKGATIAELPVAHHARLRGKSKYGLGRTTKVLLDLVTAKFMGTYAHSPIYLFGGLGLVLIVLGLLVAVGMFVQKYVSGVSLIQTPLLLLTALLLLMGFFAIMLGLLTELMVRTYFESQGKPTYVVRETLSEDASGKR